MSVPRSIGTAGGVPAPGTASMVVLITNIPTPYRIPLFNEIHAQLARVGIGFKVVFAALTYPRRKWAIDMAECRFPWEVLGAGRLPSRNPESAVFTYAGLGRVLRSNPGALHIVSGFSLATTRLWLRSFFRATPYLIWSGAIERKNRPDSFLHRCQRRRLVARAHGFVAYGTRAREYLVGVGADPATVSIAINTVDTQFFRNAAAARARTTEPQGMPTELVYVGDLSPRKRADLLIRATAKLTSNRRDFVLRLVGTGSEENSLRCLCRSLGVEGLVRFEGFCQKAEVAALLSRARCFLFPTSFDIWGLVLVEAMAAGLLCLASVNAGATNDLIRDHVSGFALDFEDVDGVAARLAWALDHPAESLSIGTRAAQFISEHVSLAQSAGGFTTAVTKLRPAVGAFVSGLGAFAPAPTRNLT